MGLTGGFADVGGLYDCLYGISAGLADDSILDKYSDVRRQKYLEVIDPVSSGNLRRLWDPDAIESDDFIRMVRKAERDKEFARQMQQVKPQGESPRRSADLFMQGVKAVMYDFTQHFRR
jgi:hypothetical protein